MPSSPWVTLSNPQPNQEYLVLLSYLPLKRWRSPPLFCRFVSAIQKQLRTTEGVMGYSLRAHLLSREFWTLSVWRDSQAQNTFVHTSPHLEVMSPLQGEMGPTKFIEWRAQGAVLSPKWKEAIERLRNEQSKTKRGSLNPDSLDRLSQSDPVHLVRRQDHVQGVPMNAKLFLQKIFKFFEGNRFRLRVADVIFPEQRIEFYILLNHEMVDIVTYDVLIVVALPLERRKAAL